MSVKISGKRNMAKHDPIETHEKYIFKSKLDGFYFTRSSFCLG